MDVGALQASRDGKRLEVNPDDKTAVVFAHHQLTDPHDVVEQLRTLISRSKSCFLRQTHDRWRVVCRLSNRTADGKLCLSGYHPRPKLPMRVERIAEIKEAANSPLVSTETFEDIIFDEPLNDELFSLVPPAGYAVTESGKPRASLAEVFREKLMIVPKVGIGPLQFGMSEDEVLELLGKPDEVITRVPQVPITDEVSDID